MHLIQKKIIQLASSNKNEDLSLRRIAQLIGEDPKQPQKIKHHIQQLEIKGLLKFDTEKRSLIKNTPTAHRSDLFVSIPLLGSANCGEANIWADEHLEGYLKVTRSLLKNKITKGLFAIRAVGTSMNKANIEGKEICDGDFLIVDSTHKFPQDNDYVVSIIDGQANVKKFRLDKDNNQIVLISESSLEAPPIFIHPSDLKDYMIAGKVVQVIKKPKQ